MKTPELYVYHNPFINKTILKINGIIIANTRLCEVVRHGALFEWISQLIPLFFEETNSSDIQFQFDGLDSDANIVKQAVKTFLQSSADKKLVDKYSIDVIPLKQRIESLKNLYTLVIEGPINEFRSSEVTTFFNEILAVDLNKIKPTSKYYAQENCVSKLDPMISLLKKGVDILQAVESRHNLADSLFEALVESELDLQGADNDIKFFYQKECELSEMIEFLTNIRFVEFKLSTNSMDMIQKIEDLVSAIADKIDGICLLGELDFEKGNYYIKRIYDVVKQLVQLINDTINDCLRIDQIDQLEIIKNKCPQQIGEDIKKLLPKLEQILVKEFKCIDNTALVLLTKSRIVKLSSNWWDYYIAKTVDISLEMNTYKSQIYSFLKEAKILLNRESELNFEVAKRSIASSDYAIDKCRNDNINAYYDSVDKKEQLENIVTKRKNIVAWHKEFRVSLSAVCSVCDWRTP